MDLSQALATFFDESRDLLADMERILLRAESDALEGEEMNALFRCAHTIKGSAGLFGLDPVVRFTHEVETVLDRLRQGELAFTPALVGLLLEARDHMAALVAAATAGGEAPPAPALLDGLRAAGGGARPADLPATVAAPLVAVEASGGGPLGNDCWHLSLRFEREVLQSGFDPLAMIHFLGSLGTVVHLETVADMLPDLAALDPELCYLGFEVALKSGASKAEIEGVFEFVLDQARITILPPHSRLDDFLALIEESGEDKFRLGELLVACGSVTEHELARALAAQQEAAPPVRLGEMLVGQGAVQPALVDAALAQQKKVEERRSSEAKSMKIPADRLDALIDQVGELVIAGAATQLQAKRANQRELQEAASNLLRLVEDVRDSALRLRMTPIGEVFGRFPRVVRDVARELGKDIELAISGADAELDKSMVERIGDPLMHLVRNAIDHGIEPPERRTAAGKPARGTVSLNAYHESGSIVIEVADDGGGLNSERILQKAIAKGLVAADASLAPADIHRLILEPGFSTAEQVTNLSGRGVGMDVVKSNVEALRGTLDIDSRPGQGTTMRICLPLTLAIIDGFQVGVGLATFIVPLDTVVECIELPAGAAGADYLNLRGEVLPFLRLRRVFAVAGDEPLRQNIVVVRFGGRKAGIAVDRLFGECQTVIKPLGRLFSGVSGISGSTILGSGEVALILDVAQLVHGAALPAGTKVPTPAPAA
ncbi:chemotaxis protein CheA [Azospira restricta]|uniref:Chemotaxis protein CheA n=1 Tax=Azospira restricta TaxID=404405 RepID=A0A974SN59_9RHOO|nr:chemotaxis protein CheA [Azospira restricta]QRJ63142.1 chemotaxis protein CheA [Azospira restricta]